MIWIHLKFKRILSLETLNARAVQPLPQVPSADCPCFWIFKVFRHFHDLQRKWQGIIFAPTYKANTDKKRQLHRSCCVALGEIQT